MRKALFVILAAACGHAAATVESAASAPAQAAAVSILAPDRSPEDKALDNGRKPVEFIAFSEIRPGMKVAELGAGRGYTSELLARAVGPSGTVYAQNSKMILGFTGKDWDARLEKPAMKNVVRVDREFDDPLPPEAKDLDAVVIAYLYHDTVHMGVDRDKMNRAVFAALKPGGVYLVADHSGRDGTGTTEVKTLHRIEEKVVVDEVQQAGFKLAGSGDFLRNPKDTRDWNDSPLASGDRRGTSDRFVLKFVKPKP